MKKKMSKNYSGTKEGVRPARSTFDNMGTGYGNETVGEQGSSKGVNSGKNVSYVNNPSAITPKSNGGKSRSTMPVENAREGMVGK